MAEPIRDIMCHNGTLRKYYGIIVNILYLQCNLTLRFDPVQTYASKPTIFIIHTGILFFVCISIAPHCYLV